MLTSVHFLLTYACTFECDHCFLYCGPHAEGTFTRKQLEMAFDQIADVDTITSAYFEGGESFLFYPLLVEGIRMARSVGLDVGIVTNCYWSTSIDDAALWLEPMARLGVHDLSLSDDAFHHGETRPSPAEMAKEAAVHLGMPVGTICIEPASVVSRGTGSGEKGLPVIGGSVRFRGRAAEKLIGDLPRTPASTFTECPDEDFRDPGRVHLDSFGNLHLCQGLLMGNIWQKPLKEILRDYDPESHPIIKSLIKGGPAQLARDYDFDTSTGYVDTCHLCYEVRRSLLDRFPQHLGPRQVYGLD
jgi:hypothetical protein